MRTTHQRCACQSHSRTSYRPRSASHDEITPEHVEPAIDSLLEQAEARIAELERRLRARAQDPDAVIAHRMARARDEISHWDAYDYVLINDDLDRCEQEIRRILAAERLRRARRPGLVGFVQGLNREFQDRRS